MTSVRGYRRPRRECLSVTSSIPPLDFSPPSESGNELSSQPVGHLGSKLLANSPPATICVPKYSKDNLQRIFKAVLKVRALAPVPAPAPTLVPVPIVSEVSRKKLKARSPNVYCGKSYMDCYNFC